MALKQITPPATEPVSLTEIKSHLRIDDDNDDSDLEGFITSAREDCEGFQNRAYITQTWEITLDCWPCFPIKLPLPPLVSVTSIKYFDTANVETTWADSNYFVDADSEPGRIDLAYGITLPTTTIRPMNAIKIRFVCGYGNAVNVPQAVKQAIKLMVGDSNENRESTSEKKIEDLPAVASLLWKDRIVPI